MYKFKRGKKSDAVACLSWQGGKGTAGPEEGGDWTSHRRLNAHIFELFKSYKNSTLLVRWTKMRWVKWAAPHVDTEATPKCAERQCGKIN